MVIEDAILEWEQELPWQLKSQIEQDLIICRALCALYNDEYLSEHLAFRGCYYDQMKNIIHKRRGG